MSVTVRIPTQLRALVDGAGEVEVGAGTVEELISELGHLSPDFRTRLLEDSGELRRFINVYVDGEDVRFLAGLATSIPQGTSVSIIPAVAGG